MCMNPMPKPTFWQMQGQRSPQAEGFTLYEGIAWPLSCLLDIYAVEWGSIRHRAPTCPNYLPSDTLHNHEKFCPYPLH